MVEFDRPAEMPDREIARVQVLRVSWDTERNEWFYLPAPDVDEKLEPDDDLHWTGIANVGTTCALIAIRPICRKISTSRR